MTQTVDAVLRPQMEAMEGRILFSAYSISDIGVLGPYSGGSAPPTALIADSKGNFYGTLLENAATYGAVYEIAKGSSAITTLATFDYANGAYPWSITLDASGNIFGTTTQNGDGYSTSYGTVFELAAGSNTITTLATFNGADGAIPSGSLAMDSAGTLFGTTDAGGPAEYGTVFELPKGSGTLTTLAMFNGADGETPEDGLTVDASGNLYGTTAAGGSYGDGTVFMIARGSSTLTTLASFNGANGSDPIDSVTLDGSGNLYGTTSAGGDDYEGTVFEIAGGSNAITTIASFNGRGGGARPYGGITLDGSGDLLGTTWSGGTNNDGSVFEIARGSNTVTILSSFDGANGMNPHTSVTLDASGNIYGTAFYGGANGDGAVFELVPNPVPTVTLSLTTGSNPSNTGQTLTFTASASDGVPYPETVTLLDTSNNNAVVATGTLSGGSATLAVPANTLSAGTHNVVAAYAGDANFAASESAPYAQTVQAAVTSVVVNGNNAALAGAQRSMVDGIVYTFSQAVTLAATNAFTIGVHNGQPGTAPSLAWAAINPDATGASTQWVVTFSGAGVTGGSIGDGVYDITLNPSAASVEGNASATVAARPADTFYRLYGDLTGDGRVNNADYNLLLNSFNLKPGDAGYLAALDASGTGSRINNADYNLFLNNFNVRFTGFTATI